MGVSDRLAICIDDAGICPIEAAELVSAKAKKVTSKGATPVVEPLASREGPVAAVPPALKSARLTVVSVFPAETMVLGVIGAWLPYGANEVGILLPCSC